MRRRTDIVAAIVIAAVAIVLLVWIIPQHTSPPQSEGNLSPAFMPSLAVGVMLVLAILLGVSAWFSRDDGDGVEHEEFGTEAHGIGLTDAADVALWGCFAAAMMVGFLTVGFIPTAIPALVVLMLYAGQRSPVLIGSVAIAVPVLIHQIAWHAFTVQMP